MKKQIAARGLKDLYLGATVQFDTWHEREYFDTVTGPVLFTVASAPAFRYLLQPNLLLR